ncbi:MAG: arylsulfatase A-like enzyme, partial [Dinoroseobacter sp.]
WEREAPIFFEHEGNAAIRAGQFKLVRQFGQDWELYDMERDRTELHDLAGSNAPLEAELLKHYEDWAAKQGVLDWKVALPRLLEAWQIGSAQG